MIVSPMANFIVTETIPPECTEKKAGLAITAGRPECERRVKSYILSSKAQLDLYKNATCFAKYERVEFPPGTSYCKPAYDGYLCWPPTEAGKEVFQKCPAAKLSDTSKSAFRVCDLSGLWMGRQANESSVTGWTNYTPCYPAEVRLLFGRIYNNEEDAQDKFEVARITRYLEITGFSISLVALSLSLFIFCYYRSLRNNRTRIHKNLFIAMLIQVIIRLAVYIDQALVRKGPDNYAAEQNDTLYGIDNIPYLCESSYILLEYATTAMFMWKFIEGLYLHNLVTANSLREQGSHTLYYATGWGLPLVNNVIWATMSALHYQRENMQTCWYGYNFSPLFWIVQGPRLAVILVNFLFLLNIMRVLIVKLRQSHNSEMKKIRKAVRAALVLLPLLGITNALSMIEAPLDESAWKFALWSYTTHFMRSFQGFFIALIYCFLNGEVQLAIRKQYMNYMAMRRNNMRRHRDSLFYRGRTSNQMQIDAANDIRLRELALDRPRSYYHTVCESNLNSRHPRYQNRTSDRSGSCVISHNVDTNRTEETVSSDWRPKGFRYTSFQETPYDARTRGGYELTAM